MQKIKKYRFPLIISAIILVTFITVYQVGIHLENTSKQDVIDSNNVRTFEKVQKYESRAGEEEMKIILSVENDLIKDIKVEHVANNRVSTNYQNQFSEGVNGVIVGKKITDEFEKTVINGASVTSMAFWDALDSIKSM